MFEEILSGLDFPNKAVLESVIELAVEIAREGREGRRIGTLFMVGDDVRVLAESRPLILDPIALHPIENRSIYDPALRESLKELVQLDGAFIFSDDGIIVAGCRYLDARAGTVPLQLGLGSRHLAAASMSRSTDAVGIVVSESGIVRIFEHGQLIARIIPELWLLKRHSIHFDKGA